MASPIPTPPFDRALARRVYDIAYLTGPLHGPFTLRSGAISHEYFDKYRFESDPVLLRDVAAAMAELPPLRRGGSGNGSGPRAGTGADDQAGPASAPDALAGLELGGVPIATMLSQLTGLAARFVRKTAKEYGTKRIAEGGEIEGRRLLIVEDVVTSGGAILDAAVELRRQGALLGPVVCVIDRESGGREKLAEADLELHPLFTMSQLKEAAGSTGTS